MHPSLRVLACYALITTWSLFCESDVVDVVRISRFKAVLGHFGGSSINQKVLMKRHAAGLQKADDVVLIEVKDGGEEP